METSIEYKTENTSIEECSEMFDSVCRICLQENGVLFSLYDKPEGSDLSFSDKIMQLHKINLEKKYANLPQQICASCISDLDASYRFRMNCESSNAVLQSYIDSTDATDAIAEDLSEAEEEIITEAESEADPELPVDESELYNYQNGMYDENGDMICEEDNLEENALDDNIKQKYIVEVKEPKSEKKKESSKSKAARAKKNQIEKRSIEDQQKIHTCEICGNSYKYRHALEVHMRRHRGEKPYKCEYCERCFVIRFELKRHMRTHTGAKPYGCRFCERKFSDFGSRIKHERSHTGERPYICQTCGKTFAYSHVLSGHMLTHTGEKRHQCQTCGKRFTKSHHLKSHLNTHLKALNKQASMAQPPANQDQIKIELLPQQMHDVIKNEPQLHVSASDDQDLMNVVQLGFQVINT